jgi:hypothetical protein
MRSRWIATALAACGAFGSLVASAPAATIEVTSEADSGRGSLGDAIVRSQPGGTIEIPPGTYPLTNGDVLKDRDLHLVGAGAARTTIVPTGGGEALEDEGVTTEALTIAPPLNPTADNAGEGSSGIGTRAQVIAIVITLAIFLLVLELVRRRRLVERYALLWLSAALALLVLAIWTDGLDVIADAMGIAEPANAIFILAFGVVFVLLLHFSVATSRLAEETKILAQEVARLDQELREERSNGLPGELRSERGAPSSATTADQ